MLLRFALMVIVTRSNLVLLGWQPAGWRDPRNVPGIYGGKEDSSDEMEGNRSARRKCGRGDEAITNVTPG